MDSFELPLKRRLEIENAVRAADDLLSGRTVWEAGPFHLEVSTNNACNLSCIMCERPDLAFIEAHTLQRMAEEVLPRASIITPSATSEPAMGDFDRIMDLCERFDLRLNLITNGTLITDRHIERLRRRIFRVDFSIDSHIPHLYEEIRRGGQFPRMRAGLRRLVALSREEGFPLTLVVVLMKQNLPTLAGLVRFARAEAIDRVRVQKLLPFFGDPERFHVGEVFTPSEVRAHLDAAIAAAADEGVSLELDLDPPESYPAPQVAEPPLAPPAVAHAFYEALQRIRPATCFQLNSYARVIPDGSVYPCCRGWGDDLRMGNVNERSFEDIWNGPAYQRLREEFATGELREGCRNCTLSGQGSL